METNYWLIKSEPDAFSIDDLKNAPGKKDHWDGIRNYQARNFIRDAVWCRGYKNYMFRPVGRGRNGADRTV